MLFRLAQLTGDPGERAFWAAGASTCLTVETQLHRTWSADGEVEVAPGTQEYLSHLRQAVEQGYEQGVAAVLPCYWMYADVGARLAPAPETNPYHEWIATYADPLFVQSAERARAITERVAEAAAPQVQESMWQAFEKSARLERDFFAAPLVPVLNPA